MLFEIETERNFVNQNKGKITLKMVQNGFSYDLTFWFISIENSGKQKKSKNTLREEINPFCDG